MTRGLPIWRRLRRHPYGPLILWVAAGFTKAVLRGSVSGRYEDLRRFIHHLETADGFLFIEDLNVSRHSTKKSEAVAFQITISTYIREGPGQRVSSPAFSP